MKTNERQKKGISLIVLIITIVVMVILAGVIILALTDDDIINNSKEAVAKSDFVNLKEAAETQLVSWKLAVKLNKTDKTADEYVKEKLIDQGIDEKNIKLVEISEEGELNIYPYPVIPEGFIASDIEGEDSVAEGLVIYEGNAKVSTDADAKTTRNQYVWIPVLDINEFKLRDGYREGKLQTLVSSGRNTEPFSKSTLSATNDLTGEYAEYAKMKASVEKYGGFYVARYEAGSVTQRVEKTEGNGTTVLVPSKKDVYPYSCVLWGKSMTNVNDETTKEGYGAVYLSRSVYPESSNNSVVSTLIYGVQWDAMLDFMKNVKNPNGITSEYYIHDGTGMSWDYNNYTQGNPNTKTGIDLGTNALNKVKNIYDVSGNKSEFTMESEDLYFKVSRGGSTFNTSTPDIWPASSRGGGLPEMGSPYKSFRIALYIK